MRQIILVPTAWDLTFEGREYWENFVWRVKDALQRDGLASQVLIADATVQKVVHPIGKPENS